MNRPTPASQAPEGIEKLVDDLREEAREVEPDAEHLSEPLCQHVLALVDRSREAADELEAKAAEIAQVRAWLNVANKEWYDANARAEAAEARLASLTSPDGASRALLKKAAETFRRYEELHRAKGTPEAYEKSKANGEIAHEIECHLDWLATPPERPEIGELIEALEAIKAVPTKAWSIDTAHRIAVRALKRAVLTSPSSAGRENQDRGASPAATALSSADADQAPSGLAPDGLQSTGAGAGE